MRTPIAQALAAPDRIDAGVARLDYSHLAALTFEPVDRRRFPCVDLAYAALAADEAAPVALNAANEVAVAAFLRGEARFGDIPRACSAVLERRRVAPIRTLDDALAADAEARALASAALRLPRPARGASAPAPSSGARTNAPVPPGSSVPFGARR
jgi:1-deoxy-D-xylulose-5-phosphate reductoisomerase